jgi:hypothetical protein
MTSIQRASPSTESVRAEDTTTTTVALPASMQTLVERYTDRSLTNEERCVLAKATPNVRCEALRIFFEMNDAAAAVEYVLHHHSNSSSSNTPAPSSQRHSGEHDSGSNSIRQSVSSRTAGRFKASRSATNAASSAPHSATAQRALGPLSTNAQHFSSNKPAAEGKKAGKPTAASLTLGNLPLAADITEGVAPTPMNQKMLQPPSLSGNGGGAGPNSGSRPRRVSAARRGESMCTLVTVSSMSDNDEDEGAAMMAVHHGRGVSASMNDSRELDEEEAEEEMPPTVTLRSREPRSTPSGAAGAAPQVPVPAFDSVLKPHVEPASAPNNVPLPVVSAPADRPSLKSPTPIAATPSASADVSSAAAAVVVAASLRDVSPSVLPPPGAVRMETSIVVPSLSPCSAAPVTVSPPTAMVVPPTHPGDGGQEEEGARKTVAAKPTPMKRTVTAEEDNTEPAAGTTVPVPSSKLLSIKKQTATQVPPPQQQHHVAFTDAKAMALLDAYRHNKAPPLGYRDEVELAYTELSCGHSSASPSVASGVCGSHGGAPKSAVDWAALVASVRGPQTPAPAAVAKPTTAMPFSPRTDRHPTTTAAADAVALTGTAATTTAAALRTPRGSGVTAPQRKSTTEAGKAAAAVPPSQSRRTPRGSQESGSKRQSGGSGQGSVTKKPVAAAAAVEYATQPSTTRKKRASAHGAPATTDAAATAAPAVKPEKEVRKQLTPEKQPQVRSANASPLKRGVAWDDTTGMYITHPNQRRRQLAAAAAAAAPLLSTPSNAVRAAGASALETPDVLHTYFGRTASAAVVAGADAAEMARRTPAGTTAAAAFGRLCSSALHLSSGAAALPGREAEEMKTPRTAPTGTPSLRKKAAATASAASPPSSSTTSRFLKGKRTAAHAPLVVVATPRQPHPHGTANATAAATPTGAAYAKVNTEYARLRSGYVAPADANVTAAAAMSAGFQRLRSGCPAVQPHDVYREGGEVIALQRQASQYHSSLSFASSETLRRLASAVPALRRPCEMEIQPSSYVYCPSTIRSPRTARTPQGAAAVMTPASQEDATQLNNSGWTSTRGPLYQRCASNYHHPHQPPPHHGESASHEAAPVPPAQCGVFERLTSNYYAVYTSAAALQTPSTVLGSPRGRNVTGSGGSGSHSARRRSTSAPAGNAGRRAAVRRNPPYPALREGWLSPDGKVAATRWGETEEAAAAATSAPVKNTFARSNTSRYLHLSK